MYKIILGFAALGLASLSSRNQGDFDFLTKKWQVVTDKAELARQDSLYQNQLKSIDTMTVFPEDVLEMKKEMKRMPADSLDNLPEELVYLLKSSTIKEFKVRMRASAEQIKHREDSTMLGRVMVFEFEKSGLLKRYTSDNPDYADTSTLYSYKSSIRKIAMFGNPAVFKGALAKDTVFFDVLYLDNDSMSLNIDPKSNIRSQQAMKPMNFIPYKNEERER